MKINSHSWRSIAAPSKMDQLKNQILEAKPSTILKKMSQTFKKTDGSAKSMMEAQSKKGLSVVKEMEEEKEVAKKEEAKKEEVTKEEAKEEEAVDEFPDEICLDPLTEKTDVEWRVCSTKPFI